mgnify:FL=1|jgi:hypothetical protein
MIIDNGHDSEGNYAPHCLECRMNGYDATLKFADMCSRCQDNKVKKSFQWERRNAVENYIVDNA